LFLNQFSHYQLVSYFLAKVGCTFIVLRVCEILPLLATQPLVFRHTKLMTLACRLSDCPTCRLDRKGVKRHVLRYMWDSAGSQRSRLFWTEGFVLTVKLFVKFVTFSALTTGRRKLPSLKERAWTTPTCFACYSYVTSSSPPSSHHNNFRLSPRSL